MRGRGYPNPSGMGFTFSSSSDMGRITGKYMRIGYGGRGMLNSSPPRPIAMPNLISIRLSLGHTTSLKLLGESATYLGLTMFEGLVTAVARGGYPVYT